MRLHDVARWFDQEQVFDGYTGRLLFRGQLSNFNDHASAVAALRRRTLSTAPGYSLPARRCLKMGQQRWLASVGVSDNFQGVEIRATYNLRLATSLFKVLTPGQVCVAPGTPLLAYGYEEFFKDSGDTIDSNETSVLWNIFFSPTEPVADGMLLVTGARCLRVKQAYATAEGLTIAEVDEFDPDWSQTVVFSDLGSYDAKTDTNSSVSVTVPVVQVDLAKFYRWRLLIEADRKPGDRIILAPSLVTPKVGSHVAMLGRKWRVMQVQLEIDAWAVHVRPT